MREGYVRMKGSMGWCEGMREGVYSREGERDTVRV